MNEQLRGNLSRGSAETENTNENADVEKLRSEMWQDVSGWLPDFKENLVDKDELPMEPRAQVEPGSGKHGVERSKLPSRLANQEGQGRLAEGALAKQYLSQETEKSLQKFLEPTRKPKSHLHLQFLGNWQVLRGIILESLYVNATQIGNK